jgi:hypothetical protein
MNTTKIETAADLYEELTALPGTEVFLLGGDSIYGPGGLTGLRLIASSLYESVWGVDANRQTPAPSPQISPRLAQAEALLDRCRGDKGVDFIVCITFDGESGWHLRWSQGWSHMHAVRKLVEVVRYNLLIHECDE